ncbi:glycosyltransferase family 4 protein [Pontibacter sp. HSC-36F09]|uniref:glycosyltransferase family 4 protein n=1 Tax=Pontibacter sp. HSC-36F09 TaxID=2910966 RepID=UPI00209FC5A9|nr:glycosyltransferase family 4 protein [Pontibacter sp. HSC-36F09]MCP2043682.1 glycosyltransferase involved in cell wall biosynthesis [Pontibacter sp. HSC-36F09]
MRVLFFPKYTRLGASSRLRTYQYLPYFREQGIDVECSPLFDDLYLQQLYQKKAISKVRIIQAYISRLFKLFASAKYDLVVIEKELFPYFPAFAEQALALLKVKYIVDYDDAIFHNYDLHPNKWIRTLLKRKIAKVMNGASLVVAGNKYLKDYAQKAGTRKTTIIPTVINTDHYTAKNAKNQGEVIIGWIGSPTTLKYVKNIVPVLKDLRSKYPLRLHIIGGKAGVGFDNYEEVFEWSEEAEVELIKHFDIGVMPLNDDAWEKGKCGYKLIQYMGCGLPVVGSPIGVNDEIIQDGINGYKATDLISWKQGLEKLLADKNLRETMGKEGRALVEENYSYKVAKDKWLQSLLGVYNF